MCLCLGKVPMSLGMRKESLFESVSLFGKSSDVWHRQFVFVSLSVVVICSSALNMLLVVVGVNRRRNCCRCPWWVVISIDPFYVVLCPWILLLLLLCCYANGIPVLVTGPKYRYVTWHPCFGTKYVWGYVIVLYLIGYPLESLQTVGRWSS